jgi:hypothetical protein
MATKKKFEPFVVVGEFAVVVLVDERDDAQHLVVRITDRHAQDRPRASRALCFAVEPGGIQGCPMFSLQNKNPTLGKFWRVLQWKILAYFMTIWFFLQPLDIFYGHLVYFMVIWYISPLFVSLYQEKSGNLAWGRT